MSLKKFQQVDKDSRSSGLPVWIDTTPGVIKAIEPDPDEPGVYFVVVGDMHVFRVSALEVEEYLGIGTLHQFEFPDPATHDSGNHQPVEEPLEQSKVEVCDHVTLLDGRQLEIQTVVRSPEGEMQRVCLVDKHGLEEWMEADEFWLFLVTSNHNSPINAEDHPGWKQESEAALKEWFSELDQIELDQIESEGDDE